MDSITTLPRSRAGRPTREQAEARHNELLEAALDHFLDKGFEVATIEAIAQSVGMTKRTVYARYPDKIALFRAMKSCGPLSASTEAHCAMVHAPEVCWPWIMSMALISGSGPAA